MDQVNIPIKEDGAHEPTNDPPSSFDTVKSSEPANDLAPDPFSTPSAKPPSPSAVRILRRYLSKLRTWLTMWIKATLEKDSNLGTAIVPLGKREAGEPKRELAPSKSLPEPVPEIQLSHQEKPSSPSVESHNRDQSTLALPATGGAVQKPVSSKLEFPKGICWYFVRTGRCRRWGARCKYSHDVGNPPRLQPPQSCPPISVPQLSLSLHEQDASSVPMDSVRNAESRLLVICPYFITDGCTFSPDCRFCHPCKYFFTSKCAFGEACRLSHDPILPRLEVVKHDLNSRRLQDPEHDSTKQLPTPPDALPIGLELLEICPYFLFHGCSASTDCGYCHPCRNFLLGGCTLRERCRFSHDPRLLQLGEAQQDLITYQPLEPQGPVHDLTEQKQNYLSNVPPEQKYQNPVQLQVTAPQDTNLFPTQNYQPVYPARSDPPTSSTEETDEGEPLSPTAESPSIPTSPSAGTSHESDIGLPDKCPSTEEILFSGLADYPTVVSAERKAQTVGGRSDSLVQSSLASPAMSHRSCPEPRNNCGDRSLLLTAISEYTSIGCEFQPRLYCTYRQLIITNAVHLEIPQQSPE